MSDAGYLHGKAHEERLNPVGLALFRGSAVDTTQSPLRKDWIVIGKSSLIGIMSLSYQFDKQTDMEWNVKKNSLVNMERSRPTPHDLSDTT